MNKRYETSLLLPCYTTRPSFTTIRGISSILWISSKFKYLILNSDDTFKNTTSIFSEELFHVVYIMFHVTVQRSQGLITGNIGIRRKHAWQIIFYWVQIRESTEYYKNIPTLSLSHLLTIFPTGNIPKMLKQTQPSLPPLHRMLKRWQEALQNCGIASSFSSARPVSPELNPPILGITGAGGKKRAVRSS